jgi:hypothetical protein
MFAGSPTVRSRQQPAQSNHLIQLFDSAETLGAAVGRFFADACDAGDRLLLVAKPAHVDAIAAALRRRGPAMVPLVDAGRLIVLDAATTLRLIMKRGIPNISALWTVIENTVEHLAPDGGRISIYGELVEILAEEGNFRGAEQIEAFWNEFGVVHPISLFCGYSSAHFVTPGAIAALTRICAAHDHVLQHRGDLLANWLLSRRPVAHA